MWNLYYIISDEDGDIRRFSNLHECTFKKVLNEQIFSGPLRYPKFSQKTFKNRFKILNRNEPDTHKITNRRYY